MDNIFVIALIFSYFRVPLEDQHRVLFWGILGALVMRGVMIGLGAALIARFDWIIYVFGGFLVFTAARMLVAGHEEHRPREEPGDPPRAAHLSRHARNPRRRASSSRRRPAAATPLFLVLLMVEASDLLFAVDSIPAIFAVTRDPFLVFTSNVFAILGLRNLYFALAPLLDKLQYLKPSLVFILAFVGVKMILAHHQPIPTLASLAVIMGILVVGILASAFAAGREAPPLRSPIENDIETLSRVTIGAAHKIIALAVGSTVLILGVAALTLPRPEVFVVPLGLVVLAAEMLWARRSAESAPRRKSGPSPALPTSPKRSSCAVNRSLPPSGSCSSRSASPSSPGRRSCSSCLLPTDAEGLWRVELEIDGARRGRPRQRARAAADLGAEQEVFDERPTSDRLVFTIRTEDGERIGVWSGRFDGVHSIVARLPRAARRGRRRRCRRGIGAAAARDRCAYAGVDARVPERRARDRRRLSRRARAAARPSDPLGRMRTLFGYVADEIATCERQRRRAAHARAREGSALGKSRAARHAAARGRDSRRASCAGLAAARAAQRRARPQWVEAWIDGRLDSDLADDGFFATRPANLVALRTGVARRARGDRGRRRSAHRYHALRERLRPEELAAIMVPTNPLLARGLALPAARRRRSRRCACCCCCRSAR